MTWAKFDDGLPTNRKWRRVVKRSPEAGCLWVASICYSARYLLDGRIPKDEMDEVGPFRRPEKLAALLVEECLFEDDHDVWVIHDYLMWNPPADEVRARQEADRDRKAKQRMKGAKGVKNGPSGRFVPADVPPDIPADEIADIPPDGGAPSTATRPVPSRPSKPKSTAPAVPDPGQAILQRWWDESDPKPAQPWPAMLQVVRKMLSSGWDEGEVAWAIRDAPVISAAALTLSLNKRNRKGAPSGPAARSEEAMLAWLASEEASA